MSVSHKENVALAVCNILEHNGVSELILSICKRKLRENFMDYDPSLPWNITLVHRLHACGSSSEGLSIMNKMFGIKGDMDALCVLDTSIAHRNMEKTIGDASGLHQLVIVPSEGNPGYVLLMLIQRGRTDDLFSVVTTWDIDNLYLTNNIWREHMYTILELLNNMFHFPGSQLFTGVHHQGPSDAMMFRGWTLGMVNGFELDKSDFVLAIPCSEWPPEANEWLTRKRKFGWPPEDVITKIKQCGSYLVPVGCEGSPLEGLEWKYSFSHSEKHLIWSLSSVQFKCYAVLKLLRGFVLSELHGDIISSYIIKTSLLWTVEETGPNCWTPPMLLDCTKRCLMRITKWVTKDFCPNYIMRECNLLKNRYNAEEKCQVLKTLTGLINNLERYVCNLPPFMIELQNESLEKLARGDGKTTQLMQILKPYSSTIGNFTEVACKCGMLNLHLKNHYALFIAVHNDLQIIGSQMSTAIQEYSTSVTSEDFCRLGLVVVLTAKKHVLSLMQELSHPDTRNREKILKHIAALKKTCHPIRGNKFLVNRLYLATVYLSIKNMHRALGAVRRVHEYFQRHPYIAVDLAKFMHQGIEQNMNHMEIGLQQLCHNPDYMRMCLQLFGLDVPKHEENHATSSDSNVYINDVHFVLAESAFLPKPIQFEVILRTEVGALPSHHWKSITAIDPLVFTYFVQFWCHHQLQNNIEQLRAIKYLQKRCEDGMTTNKDTAWNLLGYCNQTVGQHTAAFDAYFQALRENSENKASLLYVAILLNELTKESLCKSHRKE